MIRIALMLTTCLAACAYDTAGVPGGELDAAPPDAPGPPDATPPDAGPPCHHVTRGLLLGDFNALHLYENGRSTLEVDGDTVQSRAAAHATVGDQLAAWLTSPERGDAHIDWIYFQCGINDVIAGGATAHALTSQMAAFLEDVHMNNPDAVVFLGALGPARSRIDTIPGTARYPLWLEIQDGYATLGALTQISTSMNDGADNLVSQCDSGDHLTPTPACDRNSALILRGWVDEAFPDVACAR